MTAVHIALGSALIAVNLAAGAWGLAAWRSRRLAPRGFWPLVRAGQALVGAQAALGGVLSLTGHALPKLHLVYGLTPLGVSLAAEQLRIASAQSVLDQRALPDAQAVGALPAAEQKAIVRAIVAREMAVMAAAAVVIAALGARASALF